MKPIFRFVLASFVAALLCSCAIPPLQPAKGVPTALYMHYRCLITPETSVDEDAVEYPAGTYHLLGENSKGVFYKPEQPILVPNPSQGDVAKMLTGGERVPRKNMGVVVSRSDFTPKYAVARTVWGAQPWKPDVPVAVGGKIKLFLSTSPDAGSGSRGDWWRE